MIADTTHNTPLSEGLRLVSDMFRMEAVDDSKAVEVSNALASDVMINIQILHQHNSTKNATCESALEQTNNMYTTAMY